MSFLSNAHTHTRYCDGQSTPEEMVAEAARLGFVSLGFSGHGNQGFDPAYSMADGRQEAYLAELRALQGKQRDRGAAPRLWVGLEQDGMTPSSQKVQNRQQFDYIIASTHYLCRNFEGKPIAVDGDPEALARYLETCLDGDIWAMVAAYYDRHASMLLEDRPDIIGHFDVVRKRAGAPGVLYALFEETHPTYRRLALEALERSAPCGGVLEVNTGGMARGYVSEPYPSLELLGAWRELGGAITLTSDCHWAGQLTYGFEAALSKLRAVGYRSLYRLGAGDALWEEIPL